MDECVLLEDPEDGEILEEDISDVVTKDFMGVVIASYSSLVPQCAKLATIYLIAPIQNAVVESVFSHQNQHRHGLDEQKGELAKEFKICIAWVVHKVYKL